LRKTVFVLPISLILNGFSPEIKKICKMKTLKILPVLLLMLTACSSVHVNTDYDKKVDFTQYKTYAYYKTGIDKVEISDLDKKRILRSIDEVMLAKGFTKSDTPDLLININAKAEKNRQRESVFCRLRLWLGNGLEPVLGKYNESFLIN